MHKIKYTRYPNNEIRAIHYYSAPRKSVNGEDERVKGNLSCPNVAPQLSQVPSEAPSPPLDISSEVFAPPAKAIRKRTKFGSVAKNTLLRAGGALDTVCQKPHYYVMLTGTLPGGTPEAMQAIADGSSWIVEQMAKWLHKYYKSEYWFYVWELQERGALHIHWCVYLPDTYTRCKLLWNWWDKWLSILNGVQEQTGVDLWIRADGSSHKRGHAVLQADAQTVYSSVAAYLSGYCSNDKDKHKRDAYSPYYPSRWWGYSRPLKRLLDSLTEQVIVEHTQYRTARTEIEGHYERVLHDSPKSHFYPHKVGVGSTVVSYHPEDKGKSAWAPLKPMIYKATTHTNTSSTIALYQRLVSETVCFLEACPKSIRNSYERLLIQLRGLCFPQPVAGYTFALRDIRAIRMIPSDLSTTLCSCAEWEPLRIRWCLLQATVEAHIPILTFDKHGYLSNREDLLKLLDNHWSQRYLGTTEAKAEERHEGAAHGSLSPRNPLFQQGELWHS